jgi:hypothetical protein
MILTGKSWERGAERLWEARAESGCTAKWIGTLPARLDDLSFRVYLKNRKLLLELGRAVAHELRWKLATYSTIAMFATHVSLSFDLWVVISNNCCMSLSGTNGKDLVWFRGPNYDAAVVDISRPLWRTALGSYAV